MPAGATLNQDTGKFSWSPSNTQTGTHTLTFKINDLKGGLDQDTIVITVTTSTTPVNDDETEVSRLEQKYNDYEEEYDDLEEDYFEAKREDDDKELDRLQDKLDDLVEDLDELKEDIGDLQSTITDNSLIDRLEDLEQDTKELKNDVKDLIEKIDDYDDNSQTSYRGYTYSAPEPSYTTEKSIKSTTAQKEITVNTVPSVTAAVTAPVAKNNWEKNRLYIWLAAGTVILIAMIIFLIKLILLKK